MSDRLPLGALLAAARVDARMSVEQVSKYTKIRAGLIRAPGPEPNPAITPARPTAADASALCNNWRHSPAP